MDFIKSEGFVGLAGILIGAIFTYLGARVKKDGDVTGIYTKEVRSLIRDLKEQSESKDEELNILRSLVDEQKNLIEDLKDQVEQALELVNKLQEDRVEIAKDIARKDKQIDVLAKLVNVLK